MEASEIKGQVDFGIITIREDEFKAVLKRFPRQDTARGRRRYNMSEVSAQNGERYLTAVVRCVEQGTSEAQSAATDLIEELAPQWLLVVGIAGGMPAHELTLGDVVASTRIYDFSVGAVQSDGSRQYATSGGPIHPAVASVVADLYAMVDDLGEWGSAASIGEARPPVDIEASKLYGSARWTEKTLASLKTHFEGGKTRAPLVTAGAIGSSDQLLKNADIASEWLASARSILAVEMESAGVYRVASHRNVPTLAIRGISDIIGLDRDPRWTPYACNTAAAFARAFVGAGPIEARAGRGSTAPVARVTPVPARGTPVPGRAFPTPARGTPVPGRVFPTPAGGTPSPGRVFPTPAGGTPSPRVFSTPAGGSPSPGRVFPTPAGGTPSPGRASPTPARGTPTFLPPTAPVRRASPAPIGRAVDAARAAASPNEPRAPVAQREKIFISFTDHDRETLFALKEALRPIEQQGFVTTWDATQIRPGEVIADKTRAAIASAKVAVLLVSSRFLASQAHEREVSTLLSAGVTLLCLYVDFSLVDLASYAYFDPQTHAQAKIKLVELGALNDPERPLRSLSASEKGATLMRAVKMIIEAARAAE